MAKNNNIGLWIVTGLVSLIFFAAGIPKVFQIVVYSDMLWRFALWDYPKWLLVLVGVVETVGAIAVLVPRTAFSAALVLSALMIGAFVTHFTHHEGRLMLVPIATLVLLYVIILKRKPRNLHLPKLRGSTPEKTANKSAEHEG